MNQALIAWSFRQLKHFPGSRSIYRWHILWYFSCKIFFCGMWIIFLLYSLFIPKQIFDLSETETMICRVCVSLYYFILYIYPSSISSVRITNTDAESRNNTVDPNLRTTLSCHGLLLDVDGGQKTLSSVAMSSLYHV